MLLERRGVQDQFAFDLLGIGGLLGPPVGIEGSLGVDSQVGAVG